MHQSGYGPRAHGHRVQDWRLDQQARGKVARHRGAGMCNEAVQEELLPQRRPTWATGRRRVHPRNYSRLYRVDLRIESRNEGVHQVHDGNTDALLSRRSPLRVWMREEGGPAALSQVLDTSMQGMLDAHVPERGASESAPERELARVRAGVDL